MRYLIPAAVTGLAVALAAGPAVAQQASGLQYPSGYVLVQSESPSVSPSDVVPVDAEVEVEDSDAACEPAGCEPSCCDAACEPCCDPGCGTCCGRNYCCSPFGGLMCCNLGEAWELPVPCGLRCMGIDWGGWISHGYYTNAYGADSNSPVAMRDVGDAYTLNQAWFYVEKALDTQKHGVDWGFRVDYVFGADGPDTQAFGSHPDAYDNRWDSSDDGVYGSALPQLYGEVGIGDLSVKFGHFYTIIGWEVVPATGNFFTSHAYTMYYGEPFTHTGVLASYAVDENVTVMGGWTQGWDTGFDNFGRGAAFLGGASVTLTDDITLIYATSIGDLGKDIGNGNIFMNSICAEVTLTDKLTYVFQHDLGINSDVAGAEDSEWYGINQYLQYTINDCWAAGLRAEWFHDDDGARVGFAGDYFAVTAGVNWKPHANWTVRPEIRYDTFDGDRDGNGDLPFNDGSDAAQLSGGFDVITTF